MPDKRDGCSRGSLHPVFVLRIFNVSSADENLRGVFQQNIHKLSRCTFNMLMHQNGHIVESGIILWSALLFHFYLVSVWL